MCDTFKNHSHGTFFFNNLIHNYFFSSSRKVSDLVCWRHGRRVRFVSIDGILCDTAWQAYVSVTRVNSLRGETQSFAYSSVVML